MCVSHSVVSNSATPWTVAHQPPLSGAWIAISFSNIYPYTYVYIYFYFSSLQEYWGLASEISMHYFFSLPPVKHAINVLFNFTALSGCILGAVRQALQKRTSEEASVRKDKAPAAAFAGGFLHPHPSRGQADSPAVPRTFCASSVLLLTSSSAHSDPLSLTSSEPLDTNPLFSFFHLLYAHLHMWPLPGFWRLPAWNISILFLPFMTFSRVMSSKTSLKPPTRPALRQRALSTWHINC